MSRFEKQGEDGGGKKREAKVENKNLKLMRREEEGRRREGKKEPRKIWNP